MNRRATWTPERAPRCSRSSVLCTPEGNTIVLITHDEGLARKAQRIVRITDGKIDDGEREVF